MLQKSILFILIFILAKTSGIIGQTIITGNVIDQDSKAVEYANVLLLNPADSVLIKGAISGGDGQFQIQANPGTYLLRISMVGYKDYISTPVTITENEQEKNLGQVRISEDAVLMNSVEVVAKKPLFEQRIDRMVVNVANSITSSGTNALEVLERSPGVVVNHQNNLISIAGKNGVVVMINGRINYMPQEAVVQMLQGMSSDNIERIEIITTPPAGFDAEGNAGYINIVLKKSQDDGFNGSYGLSFGVGHGEQGSATGNFNLRKGKINLYGDYNYLHEGQEQVFSFYRRIQLNGATVITDTKSLRDPNRNDNTGRIGLDYQLSSKTVIGALLSAYNTKWTMDAVNTSRISSNMAPDTNIRILNYELNQWKHIGGNLNLQHTFAEGRKLTADFDVLHYEDNNPTDYHNIYTNDEGNTLFDDMTRSKKITPIDIKVGKIDYATGIGKKLKMETGIKGTLSLFTNDVAVDYFKNNTWVNDPELTSKADLDEEILAAYLSLETPLGHGFTWKGGLRYEYTSSNLGTAEQENIVDRQFGEWFPSLYLSKDFNNNYSLNLSYSKRITRPTFNDMAPFRIFVDPYTFFSGNSALQPSIANKIGLGIRLKTIIVNLEYAVEDSSIARFQSSIVPGTNKQLIFAENLKNAKTWSLTSSIPVNPAKWLNIYFNLNANYQKILRYEGTSLFEYKGGGIGVFSSWTFTLPKSLTLELSGFYGSGGLFGAYDAKPIGALNAGLQKKFDKLRGSLRVGYDDVFHTLKFQGELDNKALNQYFKASLVFQQPTFKVSWTQNFGNQKVKGKRDRGTGSDEERNRVTN